MHDIVPDQDSIEGKRKRSCEIVPPVEPNPPRTRVGGSAGGREGRGVANAVELLGAVQADCESSASRCTARSSLKLRNRQSLKLEPSAIGHTDGGGFSNFCVLEGIEVVLDVYNGRLLDRDTEKRVWL